MRYNSSLAICLRIKNRRSLGIPTFYRFKVARFLPTCQNTRERLYVFPLCHELSNKRLSRKLGQSREGSTVERFLNCIKSVFHFLQYVNKL